jgi:hypothetical protein
MFPPPVLNPDTTNPVTTSAFPSQPQNESSPREQTPASPPAPSEFLTPRVKRDQRSGFPAFLTVTNPVTDAEVASLIDETP